MTSTTTTSTGSSSSRSSKVIRKVSGRKAATATAGAGAGAGAGDDVVITTGSKGRNGRKNKKIETIVNEINDVEEQKNEIITTSLKKIFIEHCKSWFVLFLLLPSLLPPPFSSFHFIIRSAFKTRAMKVYNALNNQYDVIINENKPRKGCFVIQIEGQTSPIIELLNMSRPFTKLKELDMDDVIQSIQNQLK